MASMNEGPGVLARFVSDLRGTVAVEYAVLLTMVALMIAGIALVGGNLSAIYDTLGTHF